jgi:outer membrane lipoprotein-sorting protein
MALIQPARPEQPEEYGSAGGRRRRKALRYAVPAALVGVTAATVSLVPALADTGDPSLPKLTAEQLLTKIAASDTRTVDGTVKFTTDLGLPSALSAATGSSMFGGAAAPPSLGSPDASRAEPQRQFVQLLVGSHTLHVSADGPDRQKISIIQPAAEYSLIHNGTQVWAYDSSSNEAYHATLPAHDTPAAEDRQLPKDFPATPQDAARQILAAVDGKAAITTDGTARIAGHSAYVLVVRPQHASDTTIGAARISVDAKTGVPLRFTLDAKSGGKPIVDIGYTRVSFAKPSAGTFAFTPGKGVKVTEGGTGHGKEQAPDLAPSAAAGTPTFVGSGWDTVAVFRTKGALPPGTAPNDATSWKDGKKGPHDRGPADVGAILGGFGKHVTGSFGSGTLFHTRLVNVLLTQDGTIYAGAVTQSALESAANAATS